MYVFILKHEISLYCHSMGQEVTKDWLRTMNATLGVCNLTLMAEDVQGA